MPLSLVISESEHFTGLEMLSVNELSNMSGELCRSFLPKFRLDLLTMPGYLKGLVEAELSLSASESSISLESVFNSRR